MRKIFLYFSILFLTSCYTDRDKYLEENQDKILKVEPSETVMTADGSSIITLEAFLDHKATNKAITFRTSSGYFKNTYSKELSVLATSENGVLSAKGYLVAPDSANAYATVTVINAGSERVAKLQYVNAFPDEINIEASKVSIQKTFGAELAIESYLTRTIGFPTVGQKPSYRIIDASGRDIGEARAIQGSDKAGMSKAIAVVKDTSEYTGYAFIIGSIKIDNEGHLKNDTLSFLLTK